MPFVIACVTTTCRPGVTDNWPASVRVIIDRPDQAVIDTARVCSTATVHEAQGRTGALPAAIKPIDATMRICGPAVTVLCPPGDNLRLHHALYVARPGDVLVVAVGDGHDFGYWGEIMTVAAMQAGLGGLVIDAGVRDADQLSALGWPVFSRGLCIRGTIKDPRAPGTINYPVTIGEVIVHPGDLVLGDRDGLVVIPLANVDEVLAASAAREAKEAEQMGALRLGDRTIDLFGFDPGLLS